jgi:hypothetical protein
MFTPRARGLRSQLASRTNKPTTCLDKIRKCRSADCGLGLEGEGNRIRKCRKCRRYRGLFFWLFYLTKFVISCTEGPPDRARQSCCPKVPIT